MDDITREERLAVMGAAKQFCMRHIKECCLEILEWQNTGILRDGRVRELEAILRPAVGGDYGLKVAEDMVKSSALIYIVNAN